MRKSRKNARRRPTKCRNRWKMLVVGRRNAENAEKCPSSADETQKSQKNARRRPTKCRICRKSFVIRGWKRKRGKKMPVIRGWKWKNTENHSSSVDESEKEAKNARHPWMKVEKRWKPTFRHGGWVENSENSISAAAETEKTPKIDFRPWPKA